jgi:hypothetical protein
MVLIISLPRHLSRPTASAGRVEVSELIPTSRQKTFVVILSAAKNLSFKCSWPKNWPPLSIKASGGAGLKLAPTLDFHGKSAEIRNEATLRSE